MRFPRYRDHLEQALGVEPSSGPSCAIIYPKREVGTLRKSGMKQPEFVGDVGKSERVRRKGLSPTIFQRDLRSDTSHVSQPTAKISPKKNNLPMPLFPFEFGRFEGQLTFKAHAAHESKIST